MTSFKTRSSRAIRILFALLAAAILAFPLAGCSSGEPSPDLMPHLIKTPDAAPVRPIDGFETRQMSAVSGELTDAQYRSRVDELYSVVVDFKNQPVFVENDPVKPVYDAAREVLDRYILNAWHTSADGQYRKVHSIHDYLVYYIDYDFDLYDRHNRGEDVEGDPAFNIDGVFLNKRAVCDGLSRAVTFLLAMEGIDSMRVTGSFAGEPHAWNKVCIQSGEEKIWYNMDVTADSANYMVGDDIKKQLSHGYFLLSDATFKMFSPTGTGGGTHVFDVTSVVAPVDYDYYATGVTSVGDKVFPLTVKSNEELQTIFHAISDMDGEVGKIELKLSFPGKEDVNRGDIYAQEIATAYTVLHDPDFQLTADQKPYFRFPNGVYVFLMYQ